MDTKHRNEENSDTNNEPKANYKSPSLLDVGSVESLTHGSREQTSDEPGSGYKGG